MTNDQIALRYTEESARELARDIKVMVVSVMEQSGADRDSAIRFLIYMLAEG